MGCKPILVVYLLALSACAFGQKRTLCEMGEGSFRRTVGKYTVTVTGAKDHGFPECRVTLSALRSTQVIDADSDVELLPISGASVANNGVPSLVLHAYAPNHRGNAYWIIELLDRPIVVSIDSGISEIEFVRARDGNIEMKGFDSAFEFFELSNLTDSPCPDVFLELHGSELRDVGASHTAYYDKQITRLLNDLTPQRVEAVRSEGKLESNAGQGYSQWRETRLTIIAAVLAYFYSGREEQAWVTLQGMWPANDFRRIKEEIVKTRDRGIVSKNGYRVRQLAPFE